MRKILTGDEAAAWAVRLARPDVVTAYPITPATPIVQMISRFEEEGAFSGSIAKVESEHSSMSCCIGAAAAGARVFTATSSQGLAFMHEMLHWAAGARLPVVLANVNRSLGAPWGLWTDQNDSISQRDTGWLQLYCADVQEIFDTTLQAFSLAQTLFLPVMVAFEGFYLSHTAEPADLPSQEEVDRYLPPIDTPHRLRFDRPASVNGIVGPEVFYDLRKKMQAAMDEGLKLIPREGKRFKEIFGRGYGLTESYRLGDAELVFVALGTLAGTARVAVDELRQAGVKAGLLRVRAFRPFPAAKIRQSLAKAKVVAVLDRDLSYGSGGALATETRSALAVVDGGKTPAVTGYVCGLGGVDVSLEEIVEAGRRALEGKSRADRVEWIG